MKFRVTLKDPDTLNDAISDAVHEELKKLVGVDEEEREAMEHGRVDKVSDFAAKWFKYSEYVTLELDTDAGTCVVVEQDK